MPRAKSTMPNTIGMWRYVYRSRARFARSAPCASVILACDVKMTQSKYDHHKAAATTIPSRAAAILAASSGSPAAPTPIATIDSPKAMMMMSP